MEPNTALLMLLISAGIMSRGAATQKSADAYARYVGADAYINNMAKATQSKVPEDAQFYVGGLLYIGNTIAERKITFTWRFP